MVSPLLVHGSFLPQFLLVFRHLELELLLVSFCLLPACKLCRRPLLLQLLSDGLHMRFFQVPFGRGSFHHLFLILHLLLLLILQVQLVRKPLLLDLLRHDVVFEHTLTICRNLTFLCPVRLQLQ